MGEPNRRTHQRAEHESKPSVRADSYATDVLLIAGPVDGIRSVSGGGNGAAPVEPLDMESVVRKLIALLRDEQFQA